MYKVIRQFKDTDERIYNIGEGYNGTAERIDVLATGNNVYKQKYIEEVDYSKLKVDDLKKILNEKEISFDEKAVKADLIALLGDE